MLNRWHSKLIKHFLFLLCLILIGGCSDDGAPSDASTSNNLTSTASVSYKDIVIFNSSLSARAVSDQVNHMLCWCCDVNGTIIYGPVKKNRANKVVLTNVPLEATSIFIDYLGENNQVVGFYSQRVALNTAKSVYEINNPEWEDVGDISDSINDFEIDAEDYVEIGKTITFRAIAEFTKDGQAYFQDVSLLCHWNSENFGIASNKPGSPNVFMGLRVGKTEITAILGNLSCSKNLQIVKNSSVDQDEPEENEPTDSKNEDRQKENNNLNENDDTVSKNGTDRDEEFNEIIHESQDEELNENIHENQEEEEHNNITEHNATEDSMEEYNSSELIGDELDNDDEGSDQDNVESSIEEQKSDTDIADETEETETDVEIEIETDSDMFYCYGSDDVYVYNSYDLKQDGYFFGENSLEPKLYCDEKKDTIYLLQDIRAVVFPDGGIGAGPDSLGVSAFNLNSGIIPAINGEATFYGIGFDNWIRNIYNVNFNVNADDKSKKIQCILIYDARNGYVFFDIPRLVYDMYCQIKEIKSTYRGTSRDQDWREAADIVARKFYEEYEELIELHKCGDMSRFRKTIDVDNDPEYSTWMGSFHYLRELKERAHNFCRLEESYIEGYGEGADESIKSFIEKYHSHSSYTSIGHLLKTFKSNDLEKNILQALSGEKTCNRFIEQLIEYDIVRLFDYGAYNTLGFMVEDSRLKLRGNKDPYVKDVFYMVSTTFNDGEEFNKKDIYSYKDLLKYVSGKYLYSSQYLLNPDNYSAKYKFTINAYSVRKPSLKSNPLKFGFMAHLNGDEYSYLVGDYSSLNNEESRKVKKFIRLGNSNRFLMF